MRLRLSDWSIEGNKRVAWVWFWDAPAYLRTGYKLEAAKFLRWKISTQWYPGLGIRNFM